MASDDRRALLGAIAYGDDARVTPADRLRALEQLDALGDAAPTLRAELAAASDEEVDRLWDLHMAHELPLLLADGHGPAVPARGGGAAQAAAAYQPERRKRWRLGVIAREVERRVQQLAEEMYAARKFKVVAGGRPPENVALAPKEVQPPPGLTRVTETMSDVETHGYPLGSAAASMTASPAACSNARISTKTS